MRIADMPARHRSAMHRLCYSDVYPFSNSTALFHHNINHNQQLVLLEVPTYLGGPDAIDTAYHGLGCCTTD